MANIYEPNFDVKGEQPGFRFRRARLGYQAGCETLGVSLWELPPGEATIYHYHFGNEEMAIVLKGTPSVRTPEGWDELSEGQLIAIPPGERGARQFVNRTDEPIRLLMLGTMNGPEVVVYPESDKIGVYERMTSPEKGGLGACYRRANTVEYYEGEAPPRLPKENEQPGS